MTDAYDLVSWDAAEPLGSVPGSDWLCPQNDVESLEIAHAWGPITELDVQLLAAGRPQHLMLYQYPEGQHYVEAVNSATGEVLTRSDDLRRYAGFNPNEFGYVSAFSAMNPLPIGTGYELHGLESFNEGVRMSIKGAQVPATESDYVDRMRTIMRILPAAHEMDMDARSATELWPHGVATLEMHQDNHGTRAAFCVDRFDDNKEICGSLLLGFDAAGHVTQCGVQGAYRAEPLCLPDAGIGSPEVMMPIEDPAVRGRMLDAFAEAIGFGRWRGLDLRMTASGLYQAMAVRNCDLATILVSAA